MSFATATDSAESNLTTVDKPAASRRSGTDETSAPPSFQTTSENSADKPTAGRRSCPPYNPGLQRLVEGKQAGAEPLDEETRACGFLGWHQRGYLPHHDVPGAMQLVTFRLHDAMPASLRSEWEALLHLEYWETLIGDGVNCATARRYVEVNPVKAGFVRAASEWRWSSARLRDEYCRLPVPPDRSAGLQPALDTNELHTEKP